MAFYIKSNDPEANDTYYHMENGVSIYPKDKVTAKGYSTESSAQAVIDKTDPFHWSFELKQQGKTLTVVEV